MDNGNNMIPTPQERARIIQTQLGGPRFNTMTGAKGYVYDDEGITFKIGRNSKGVNRVNITYDSSLDLYDMYFWRIRGMDCKIIGQRKSVFCNDLQKVFKEVTGMDTHL